MNVIKIYLMEERSLSQNHSRIMSIVRFTPELAGSVGECYYKEFCRKNNWAFVSLEQIYKNGIKNNVIEFKLGFNRIPIQLPSDVIHEIKTISVPSNNSRLSPSFVYDYLACKIRNSDDLIRKASRNDLCWAEIKTGMSKLTRNQIKTLGKITLDFALFFIPDIIPVEGKKSNYVKIEWEKDTPQNWRMNID